MSSRNRRSLLYLLIKKVILKHFKFSPKPHTLYNVLGSWDGILADKIWVYALATLLDWIPSMKRNQYGCVHRAGVHAVWNKYISIQFRIVDGEGRRIKVNPKCRVIVKGIKFINQIVVYNNSLCCLFWHWSHLTPHQFFNSKQVKWVGVFG